MLWKTKKAERRAVFLERGFLSKKLDEDTFLPYNDTVCD